MNYIKQNLLSIICLVLLFVMLLQRCGNITIPGPTVTIVRDTQWLAHRDTIKGSSPTITKTIPYVVKSKDTFFIPDTNYSKLRTQFESLRDMFLAENIYKDSIKFDSSKVYIMDTIFKNKIKGVGYILNFKYPTITNTITIKEPCIPKNQLYVGGALNGNLPSLVNSAEAGLIYKTKSDRLFQVKAGVDITGKIVYGVGTYWKVKL